MAPVVATTVKPVVDSLAPVVTTLQPVTDSLAPVVTTVKPVVDSLAPVVTTVKPVVSRWRRSSRRQPVVELVGSVAATARPSDSAATQTSSARPSSTAATRGGAVPSKDADGTPAATDRGLGSPAAVGRNGGVEDGRQAGVTAGAVATGPAAAKRSPATAPPVVAAAESIHVDAGPRARRR